VNLFHAQRAAAAPPIPPQFPPARWPRCKAPSTSSARRLGLPTTTARPAGGARTSSTAAFEVIVDERVPGVVDRPRRSRARDGGSLPRPRHEGDGHGHHGGGPRRTLERHGVDVPWSPQGSEGGRPPLGLGESARRTSLAAIGQRWPSCRRSSTAVRVPVIARRRPSPTGRGAGGRPRSGRGGRAPGHALSWRRARAGVPEFPEEGAPGSRGRGHPRSPTPSPASGHATLRNNLHHGGTRPRVHRSCPPSLQVGARPRTSSGTPPSRADPGWFSDADGVRSVGLIHDLPGAGEVVERVMSESARRAGSPPALGALSTRRGDPPPPFNLHVGRNCDRAVERSASSVGSRRAPRPAPDSRRTSRTSW